MSAATATRPIVVDHIDDITKLLDDDLGHDIYRVALANDAGESMSVCLPGNELRVFQKFYAALRNRGVRFADHGRYTGCLRGQQWWETDLDELLNGEPLPI